MNEIKRYENFDLLVSLGDRDAYQVRVLAAPGGATAGPVMASGHELRALAPLIAAWRELTLDRAGLRRLGAALMSWLVCGPTRELYRASLARVAADEGLRIRLRFEPSELHAIPWETCYDAETATFPACDPRTPIVRYLLGTFKRGQLTGGRRLKVLVAAAAPAGLPALRMEDEFARIARSLDDLAGRVTVRCVVAALDALQDALLDEPDVWHFTGHGGFDEAAGGFLVFDDGHGGPQMVEAEVLAAYLRGSSVRLAVLDACDSARVDPADSFAGVAPRLVQAGLPAVVAMQTALPDLLAPVFATAFYRALADGRPVDAAVTAGRVALFGHAADQVGWSIPVLYLAAGDGIVWEAAADAALPVGAPPATTSFQFTFQGPVTINAEVVGGNQYRTTTESRP
ncbi:MAG: CHAT domain-containing protein [Anaerolineae bacterium]|nr:CHAT domain-containing protein [Anaerolineae bacterium]